MNYLGDFETSRILLDKIITEIEEHCDNSMTISDEEHVSLQDLLEQIGFVREEIVKMEILSKKNGIN